MRSLWISLLWLVGTAPVFAQPIFAQYYKQQFGYLPSCNACHKNGGGSALNGYGAAFKKAGKGTAAFAAVAEQDSDGDGAKNGIEATAKANPGDATSTPANAGLWLDPNSLIPAELQAQFAGIKTWLPRDAALTDPDLKRAAALGATLTKADDNTIYIPLQDNKPVGTGLIFQGEFNKKPFFLLITTDRQLFVTQVQVINADKAPEVRKSKVFASFKGRALDKLPSASGTGVDAAITAAVKKAGTLIYVRLKGA
jgi:hypothetical protein